MDKRYAYFVLAGLAFGAMVGAAVGAANGNPLTGLGIGALVGVFIGWFAAAAAMERDKSK